MNTTRTQRRERLLDRFRASGLERLTEIAVLLHSQRPHEATVTEVRQTLQTLQGEAHMLGLASLSALVDLVIELLMGRPTVAKFERAATGVALLHQWFEGELVEDAAGKQRLDAHRRQLLALGPVRIECGAAARL